MPYEIKFADSDFIREECSIIIYGDSGIGKTTICKNMPSPFFALIRGGGEHRPLPLVKTGIPFAEINTMQEWNELILDLKGTQSTKIPKEVIEMAKILDGKDHSEGIVIGGYKVKTLVIDQFPTLYNLYMNDIIHRVSRKRDTPETPNMQDYGHARRVFTNFLMEVNNIPHLHKVYLALSEIDEDENTKDRYGAPMVPGKLALEVMLFVDFVFRMHNRREMQGGKMVEYRAFQTQPEGIWRCKDSSGKLPKYIALPNSDYNFWEEVILKCLT